MRYGFTTPSTYSSVLVILQPHPLEIFFLFYSKKIPSISTKDYSHTKVFVSTTARHLSVCKLAVACTSWGACPTQSSHQPSLLY